MNKIHIFKGELYQLSIFKERRKQIRYFFIGFFREGVILPQLSSHQLINNFRITLPLGSF